MLTRHRFSKFLVLGIILTSVLWLVAPVQATNYSVNGTASVDTKDGFVQIAHNGSFVVFASSAIRNTARFSTLYRTDIEGNQPRALVANIRELGVMALSPDDRYLVYDAGDQPFHPKKELWRVDLQTGERRQLNDGVGYWLQFSQITDDSRYVLYRRGAESEWLPSELIAVPIEGGTPVNLTLPLAEIGHVDTVITSPDSHYVVYEWERPNQNPNRVIAVPITGGSGVVLNPAGESSVAPGFRFTPDSQNIIFVSGGRLYRASVTAGNPTPLTDALPTLTLHDITPDGTYANVSTWEDSESTVLRVGVADGDVTTLATGSGQVFGMTVAPQGDYVVYALGARDNPMQLYSVNWRTAGAPQLIGTQLSAPGGCCPLFDFTPDGTHVVFVRARGTIPEPPYALFSTPVDGSTPEQMLYPGFSVLDYLMSEDGSRVFFTTLLTSGETLLSIPVVGGNTTKLFQQNATEHDFALRQTLSNNRILFYDSTDSFTSLVVADDSAPTVQFLSETQWAAESDGTVGIPVMLNAATTLTTTVEIWITSATATEGTDYTFTPQTLTFAPGDTTQTATLTLLPDGAVENGETITFALLSPTGGTLGSPTTLTITLFDTLSRLYAPLAQK